MVKSLMLTKVFADEAIDVISALPVDVLHDDHFSPVELQGSLE